MKRSIATLFALSALTLATACETVAGVGRDMEKAGESVEESAKGNQ